MHFKLNCAICNKVIDSSEFRFQKLYCCSVHFKNTKFIANQQNLLTLFARQSELLLEGCEKALNRVKLTSESLYRIAINKNHVQIYFNASVLTSNYFEAKILDMGLADHMYTKLANDIVLFTRSPHFDSITFELKNVSERNTQSILLTIGINYYNNYN